MTPWGTLKEPPSKFLIPQRKFSILTFCLDEKNFSDNINDKVSILQILRDQTYEDFDFEFDDIQNTIAAKIKAKEVFNIIKKNNLCNEIKKPKEIFTLESLSNDKKYEISKNADLALKRELKPQQKYCLSRVDSFFESIDRYSKNSNFRDTFYIVVTQEGLFNRIYGEEVFGSFSFFNENYSKYLHEKFRHYSEKYKNILFIPNFLYEEKELNQNFIFNKSFVYFDGDNICSYGKEHTVKSDLINDNYPNHSYVACDPITNNKLKETFITMEICDDHRLKSHSEDYKPSSPLLVISSDTIDFNEEAFKKSTLCAIHCDSDECKNDVHLFENGTKINKDYPRKITIERQQKIPLKITHGFAINEFPFDKKILSYIFSSYESEIKLNMSPKSNKKIILI